VEQPRLERRLAAILAADVAGYSRLTGADEEGTLARLRALRQELVDPVIAAHRGRTFKLMGDGRIVEFASVVDALRCALEVQRSMKLRSAKMAPDQRIEFRVGIHLGDVMVESDGDLMGDGVNIAARLEGIAEPGGIAISEDAYRQVQDKIAADFVDLGEQTLKNIARPLRVYRVDAGAGAAPSSAPVLALPDKPSIAVLPFQNMSGDAEQEYFCDGMVEDIITGLSRFKWLFVIARNSSFAYKGKSPDIRQVGRDLGVRYVLEGSARKAGNRVRLTGQLIEAASATHLWADRFEGPLEDIFDLQDRMTSSIVGAIEPALRTAEMRRAQTKPTESLDAYDCFLRALAQLYTATPSAYEELVTLCRRAIAIDSRYASAHGLAAFCLAVRIAQGWASNSESDRNEATTLANRAIQFGADDPTALWMGGFALDLAARDFDRALAAIERSLSLDPNSASAWAYCGWVRWHCGDGNSAIVDLQRAIRLSPRDPGAHLFKGGIAWAHFVQARYEEAINWTDMVLREQPRYVTGLRCKVSACGLLGRKEEASESLRLLLTLQPNATVTKLRELMPLKHAQNMDLYLDGLRKAGLPE